MRTHFTQQVVSNTVRPGKSTTRPTRLNPSLNATNAGNPLNQPGQVEKTGLNAATAQPKSAPRRLRFNPATLTRLRERLGLSLRKTARLVGVTPRAVMLWARGIFVPTLRNQVNLRNLMRLTKREAHDQLVAAS